MSLGPAGKGIITTTGSFTTEARKEAIRNGVPHIELVNGEKLVEMLESLELGLIPVQSYKVDDQFFTECLGRDRDRCKKPVLLLRPGPQYAIVLS
ncbi:MAG: restriction endonuclease [Elainellaceae cyanobacterium]